MKKNWLLIIVSLVVYLCLGFVVSIYLILPGINRLKDANNIKELTYEEKTELIDNINQKYLTLENETVNKYTPDINKINQKYDDLKNTITKKYNNLKNYITKKYDDLKNTITKKYDDLEKQIKGDIIEVNLEKDKEFRNNGLTKKFYELSDKWMSLNEQEMQLDSNERKELSANESNRKNELNSNESNRKNELNSNEINRKKELTNIENNKSNELDTLNKEKTNEINKISNQNIDKNSIKHVGISKIVVGIVILLIPLIYIIIVYNRLTHLANSVKEKWSQIDVLLKQRTDLIPNIVESVKGASTHEKSTLTKVTKARSEFLKATTKEEEIAASKKLSNAINAIFILKETYPELKTNRNFMDLQDNLEEIENKISFARQIYNKAVLKYKNKLEMFPSNIIASIFSFKPELFFEADDEDKINPNVKFN